MQLSAFLVDAGGAPERLEVTAEVSLGPNPAGGFHIPGIALKVRGTVPGVDADAFAKAAEAAKARCPVSKALAGTEITSDAALG
jgi:osmotically inducible protein OsmC